MSAGSTTSVLPGLRAPLRREATAPVTVSTRVVVPLRRQSRLRNFLRWPLSAEPTSVPPGEPNTRVRLPKQNPWPPGDAGRPADQQQLPEHRPRPAVSRSHGSPPIRRGSPDRSCGQGPGGSQCETSGKRSVNELPWDSVQSLKFTNSRYDTSATQHLERRGRATNGSGAGRRRRDANPAPHPGLGRGDGPGEGRGILGAKGG
jgi:hypothetical protein